MASGGLVAQGETRRVYRRVGVRRVQRVALLYVLTIGAVMLVVAGACPAHASTTELYAWGFGVQGQLGNGSTADSSTPLPVAIPAGVGVTAAANGGTDAYAVGSNGKVYAWGLGVLGGLGNGSASSSSTPVEVELPAGLGAESVAGGAYNGYALMSDGSVYAWGPGELGELGDGSAAESLTPVRVALPPGVQATAIAAGSFTAYAIGSDGHLYAWGDGLEGQLGNGSNTVSFTPIQVDLPPGVVPSSIAANEESGYAVGTNGKVYAWGGAVLGASLGDGSTGASLTPVEVEMPPEATAVGVAAGGQTGYALTTAGKAYAWGSGSDGQFGNGTLPASANTPVEVLMPLPAVAIGAAAFDGYAVGSDGNLYAWGINAYGSLGIGAIPGYIAPRPTTVTFPHPTTVREITSGSSNDAFAVVTIPQPATVTTMASSVGQTSAILNATVNPNGSAVSDCKFEYGTSESYGFSEPCAVLPEAGNSPVPVSASVTSLAVATIYHFRIVATNSGGTSFGADQTFKTLAGQPTVTSVEPDAGLDSGGTSVTITGTELAEATAVKFGAANAMSFTVNSPTSITAVAPAGTGTVDVTVTTAGGTSATSAADLFSYVQAPTVSKLSPTSGAAAGGTSVKITGTNLSDATVVKFGSAPAASFQVNSPTLITAVSPAGTSGIVDITVTTLGGTSAISLKDHFKFGPPTITHLNPNTGPKGGGTNVTVTGTGFGLGATTIFKFGTALGTAVNCTSTTRCTVVSPARKTIGPVDVHAVVSKATSPKSQPADQFTYS
jgi:alpha-tubulin suppressor-like RCC1 family protein